MELKHHARNEEVCPWTKLSTQQDPSAYLAANLPVQLFLLRSAGLFDNYIQPARLRLYLCAGH